MSKWKRKIKAKMQTEADFRNPVKLRCSCYKTRQTAGGGAGGLQRGLLDPLAAGGGLELTNATYCAALMSNFGSPCWLLSEEDKQPLPSTSTFMQGEAKQIFYASEQYFPLRQLVCTALKAVTHRWCCTSIAPVVRPVWDSGGTRLSGNALLPGSGHGAVLASLP